MKVTLELVSLEAAKAAEVAKPFTVRVLGQDISFETLNEASGIVCGLRRGSGMGASQMGSQFPIRDKARKEVGYVSYNGKVWQGTRRQWQKAVCVFGE